MDDQMIQTGDGRYVNKDYISSAGLQQAETYQQSISPTPTSTLSAENLAQNQSSVSIPAMPPATQAQGLTGEVLSLNQSAIQQKLEEDRQKAELEANESKKSLTDTMKSMIGLTEDRVQMEQEAGLADKQQRVANITSQIEARERARLNELRALESQPMSPEGKQQAASAIERKYAFELADLSLIQSAANRDYETAFNIIDRKIALKMEPLKMQLDFHKFFYEENRNILTKAEDRQFQNLIQLEEREYNEKLQVEKSIADITMMALQSGINIPQRVLSELNSARTPMEATQILARNGISLQDPLDRQMKQLQLDKMREPGAPTVKSINGVDMQWNPSTGKWDTIEANGGVDEMVVERGADKIKQLDSLINNSLGIRANAGLFRRVSLVNKQKSNDWQADVKNVMSRLTVDELGRIKADGVTFGALSNGERLAVGEAASTLINGAEKVVDKYGNTTYTGKFNISEKKVRESLELIKKYAAIDFQKRTGMPYDQYQAMQAVTPDDLSQIDLIWGDVTNTSSFNPAKFY
jgi:hypothetical protein